MLDDAPPLHRELGTKASSLISHLDLQTAIKNDPRWTVEVHRLREVLAVLLHLGLKNRTTQQGLDGAYGPYTPLLPEFQVQRLSNQVDELQQELPLSRLIEIRRELTSELATAIDISY
jgi:hypothetical protein